MTTYGTAEYWKERYDDERDRNRAESDREFERSERTRKEQARQREQEWQEQRRTASDWPAALLAQKSLMEEEQANIDRELAGWEGPPETHFGEGAKACYRAWHIWAEEQTARVEDDALLQVKIKELEQQRRELRRAIACSTADRLETEAPGNNDWRLIAGALRTVNETERDLSDWLHW